MAFLAHPLFKEFRNLALSGLTALAVRALHVTIRMRVEGWERAKLEVRHGRGAIFALWHNSLMVPLGHESRKGTRALISTGRDGEFAARVMAHFGVTAVRGSTSRDGTGALLRMVKATSPEMAIVITPDGPRGPRYRVQMGAAFLASRTGLPIIPVGIAVDRAWKLRSWDRYRIPKPFCRAQMIFGTPIFVPRARRRDQLEPDRMRIEGVLSKLSREAALRAGCAWPD